MTRRIALVLFAGAFAASAQDGLPKAETILDRYIEVTGGKAAYEKRKTEISTGTMEFVGRGVKGSITNYAAEPDRSYSVIEIEGIGKIESGASGGVVWEKSAFQGPRVKDGVEKADALRDSTFNGPLHWRKLYQKAETVGTETVNDEECYKVLLTPAEGKPETVLFNKKSGLMVKRSKLLVSPMGEIPVESYASDYKDFSGILIPTKLTQKAAGQEFTVTIQNVAVNEKLPRERFDPPADIKALLDKK